MTTVELPLNNANAAKFEELHRHIDMIITVCTISGRLLDALVTGKDGEPGEE